MTKKLSSAERQQQILQILAQMLEKPKDNKITTANIAKSIGVSEATLYRHFHNKEQMFAGLINYAETTVFSIINQINKSDNSNTIKIQHIVEVLLKFADKNPGIINLVINSQSITQSSTLAKQSTQFFRRIESQLKQTIQQNNIELDISNDPIIYIAQANAISAFIIGKWQQFVLSEFKDSPLELWENQKNNLLK